VVSSNGLTSAPITVTVTPAAPAFFTFGTVAATGHTYVAATHANFTDIAPANFISATVPSSPATPNETIILFGTGFGATQNGQATLPVTPVIVIDGYVARVDYAGMISPGVYQINAVVPAAAVRGQDALVVGLLGDGETQPNAFIPIAQ
jgi:uncharacterized protein (TIGR03437 family)